MKKIYYTTILLLLSVAGMAQQDAQYTYFMYNQQLVNPAYVGSRGAGSFTALYRHQWAGFEGAPVSQVLSFQSPFLNDRIGIGGTISHVSKGITSAWITSLAYSYKVQLTEDLNVRLGLQASLRYMGIDFSDEKVVVADLIDPSTTPGSETQKYAANVGAGLYMTYEDRYYLGVSVPHIYPNEIGINPFTPITATNSPHFYVHTGANLEVSETFSISPNFLVKYVKNAPLDVDINLNLIFNQKILTGLSYRVGGEDGGGESMDFLFLYQVSHKLALGMAYDFTLSKIKEFSSGTYEVMLRYDLKSERSDLENPRYF